MKIVKNIAAQIAPIKDMINAVPADHIADATEDLTSVKETVNAILLLLENLKIMKES